MSTQATSAEQEGSRVGIGSRDLLLAGLPVEERRLRLAGISTAVLEGGAGDPIVLLHGPGEFAAKWLRVIPGLVETHRVIAPDLPAHGSTEVPETKPTVEMFLQWLEELIQQTCASPPALVGHVLGGAIAARFAIRHSDQLASLTLVDSLGLARFLPAPRFAATLIRFQAKPSEQNYTRFMRQCSFDLDRLQREMGERWGPFVRYNLDLAGRPESKMVGRILRDFGMRRIPSSDLAAISTPTTLIWGRQDKANRLRVAEAVSETYGWPLLVIEDCADDPPRDQPAQFVEALRQCL